MLNSSVIMAGVVRPFFCICFFVCANVEANFLKMPELDEVPELEEETLLKDLDIPGVIDRDPDPNAGPRLNVDEFRVQGLFDFPEFGISREEIVSRVESLRFDLMEEGQRDETGYTKKELGEIADLVAEIEEDTKESHVGPLEVQRLVFLVREQRRSRGMTLGMIESVADTITQYYREKGFILAKAYIPKQRVRDGIVNLTLLVGELGTIDIDGNSMYSDKTIRRIFRSSIGKPVTYQRVERDLYLMTDLPGFAGRGFFSPGTQVGDTKLTVTAADEDRISAAVRFDNHGSERTGEYRAFGDLTVNNPLGYGDYLGVSVLNTFEPDNSTYGALRYGGNFFHPRFRFDLGYSTNDFVTGDGSNSEADSSAGSFDITGESRVTDVSFEYIIERSRKKNSSVRLAYAKIDTSLGLELSGAAVNIPLDTIVESNILGYSLEMLNEKRRSLHIVDVTLKKDEVEESLNFTGEKKDPFIFAGDYTRLSFIRTPISKEPARLITKLGWQYAGEKVSSVSQYALSGPKRARGYNLNRFFADDAASLSADLVYNTRWLDGAQLFGLKMKGSFQPFIFADLAWGLEKNVQNDITLVTEDQSALLSDIGIGLKFSHGALRANLTLAAPIETDIDGELEENDDSANLFFDIQYTF